jgi:hypothetical protein
MRRAPIVLAEALRCAGTEPWPAGGRKLTMKTTTSAGGRVPDELAAVLGSGVPAALQRQRQGYDARRADNDKPAR